VRIVIDHVGGSRRGQRQELADPERVRFGRHPDNEVTFDAHRDLDASSRHAELRRNGDRFRLCDIGSSNGTFVGGERVNEVAIEQGGTLEVEFGHGGPRVRIFVGGDDDEVPPPPEPERAPGRGRLLAALLLALAVTAAALVILLR
jgi:hypothetical protein